MKSKIIMLFLSVFLVSTALSQDGKVTEQVIDEGLITSEQFMSDQSIRGKAFASILYPYLIVNNYIKFVVDKWDSDDIDWKCTLYFDRNKNYRVHYIWNGPDYKTYDSGTYYGQKNHWYTFKMTWDRYWPEGFYSLEVIIEVIGGKTIGPPLSGSIHFIID